MKRSSGSLVHQTSRYPAATTDVVPADVVVPAAEAAAARSHAPAQLGRHGRAALEKHLAAVKAKLTRIAESKKRDAV